MLRTFRARLIASIVLVQILTAVTLGFTAQRATRDTLTAGLRSEARTTAQLLAAAAAPLLAELNYGALQDLAQESQGALGLAHLTLADAGGREVARAGWAPADTQATSINDGDSAPVAHEHVFSFVEPISLNGQRYGTMRFGIRDDRLVTATRYLTMRALLVAGIGVFGATLVLILLTAPMTRDLQRLTAAAKSADAGAGATFAPMRGAEEIERLSSALHLMSEALAARVAALQDSEQTQRALVNALTEGVVYRDANNRLLMCNESAAQILGISREQLMSADASAQGWQAMHPDGAPFAPGEQPSDVALRTGVEQRDVQVVLQRADGRRAWLSVNSVPLFQPGAARPHATVTSFSEVTALVEAQARLSRLNFELEGRVDARTAELVTALNAARAASQAKSEFLSRMSHELRTPLNAILGFAQILRARAAGSDSDTREQLAQIESAGWHLLALIDDVLDLARIESGGLTVHLEPVSVGAMCGECVRQAEPNALALGVTLAAAFDGAESGMVRADRARLRQVIENLLSNAIKYNRQGGKVEIFSTATDHETLDIVVRDTGQGMNEQQLARLFLPFDRLGAEASAVPGTGVGLVITRRLVDLMHGSLHVVSRPQFGSTFTVRLPRAAALAAGAAIASATEWRAEPACDVVYIEDNPSNQALLQGMLALRPWLRLHVAGTGAAGLAQTEQLRPALVIVDIALPDINGFEVCRRLRATSAGASIPIIALSANAMASDVAQGRAAGFDDYLTKPLDVAAFLDRIDCLLADSARGSMARSEA